MADCDNASVDTASTKEVLVQFGERRQVIRLPEEHDTSQSQPTETQVLVARIRAAFADRIKSSDTVVLQVRSEAWGGMFIDYFGEALSDKWIVQVVVESQPKVRILIRCWYM